MTYGVVYTITNTLNGKQYVGQTIRPIEERWADHIKDAISGKDKCRAIQSAIRKYGRDVFDMEAIIACDSREELDWMEMACIKAGRTLAPGGYNLTAGGGNGLRSDETRAKISGSLKGRSLSLEHCAKLSEAHKGKSVGPRPNLVELNRIRRGTPLSPEHRAKLSEAHKGKIHSPESRAKMSEAKRGEKNSFYGKYHSDEARRKMGPTRKTHCQNGHEFNAENTYVSPRGKRRCRICRRFQEQCRKRRRAK